jgi:predicted Zn-ribbon and HTH transcriptional regulator
LNEITRFFKRAARASAAAPPATPPAPQSVHCASRKRPPWRPIWPERQRSRASPASGEACPISSIESAGQTRRQELIDLLSEREYSFEELRHELQAGVRDLEDDLRHVERSLRREKRRLVTTPPSCSACGFAFRGRAPKRFHTPSRCPLCKSERIFPARLHVRGRS